MYEAVNNIPDEHLFISVITLGEISKGIAILPGQRKHALLKWFSTIEYEYAERLLPITAETAAIWGKITAKAQQDGFIVPRKRWPHCGNCAAIWFASDGRGM